MRPVIASEEQGQLPKLVERTELDPNAPIFNPVMSRRANTFNNSLNPNSPIFVPLEFQVYTTSETNTHFFFIGNSIFHLSLELLTNFGKRRLKVA